VASGKRLALPARKKILIIKGLKEGREKEQGNNRKMTRKIRKEGQRN
jgi:hypothetical protein